MQKSTWQTPSHNKALIIINYNYNSYNNKFLIKTLNKLEIEENFFNLKKVYLYKVSTKYLKLTCYLIEKQNSCFLRLRTSQGCLFSFSYSITFLILLANMWKSKLKHNVIYNPKKVFSSKFNKMYTGSVCWNDKILI